VNNELIRSDPTNQNSERSDFRIIWYFETMYFYPTPTTLSGSDNIPIDLLKSYA